MAFWLLILFIIMALVGALLAVGIWGLLWTLGLIGVGFYTAWFGAHVGRTVTVTNHFMEPPSDPGAFAREGREA